MSKILSLPDFIRDRRHFGIESDFNHFVTADDWTSLVADAGTTIAVNDAVGGRITLTTGATDNNEVNLRSTAEIFLIADNKPLIAEGYFQFTEANTDDANVFFGCGNAIAANMLVDDGAGLRTTGNYFMFFKLDSDTTTTWRVRSRNGTETEVNDTGITAGGTDYQRLRIEIDNEGSGGTNVQVKFFIDDLQCRDATTNKPIVHTIAIASSTEMQVGCGNKAGSANSEVLVVDYMGGWQLR